MSGEAKTREQDTIRVLIVDGEPNQLQTIKENLLLIDPAIITATTQSAHEALASLQGQHIECIVSAFKIPDMNGVQLCTEIKKTHNIPFIIYTGHGNEEVAAQAFAAGVDDYLKKKNTNTHYQVLVRRIREAVEKRRAEELYRNAVEGSRDAFAITAGTTTVFANQAMADLVGVDTPAKLIGKDSSTWVIDEDKGQFRERVGDRQLGKDVPRNITFTIRRADGAIRNIEASVSLISYRGKPASLSFARDVTDKDLAQKTLRDSEEKFRKLFSEALDAIFIGDPETGKILDCNRAATELVGRSRSELIGQPQRILHPPEEVNGKFSRTFRQHIGEKEGKVLRSQVITKDGKIKDVEIKANLTELSGEKVIQGIFRDISDRIQYEERLEALHRHATQLVQASSYEEVCDITLDTIESIMGFHLLSFLRVKEGRLENVGRRGIPPLIQGLPLDGKGISVKAVREQRSILLPDVRKDPDFIVALEGTLSELAVPIVINGKATAMINAESEKLDAFTLEDQSLLEILAAHVASAIQMIEQVKTIQASEERYRGVLETSRDGVLITNGSNFLYANLQAAKLSGFESIEEFIKSGPLGRIIEDDKKEILDRIKGRIEGEAVSPLHQFRVRLPDGRLRYLESSSSVTTYMGQTAVLAFLRDVSDRVSYRNSLEALHRHANELGSAQTISQICERTLDAMKQTLGFEFAAFLISKEDSLKIIDTRGFAAVDLPLPLSGRGLTVKAARNKQSILVNNLKEEPDFVKGATNSLSELAVPILVDGNAVAVLNVENLRLNAYTDDDQRLLQTLALHVSSAITRIRSLESEQVNRAKLEALSSHTTRLASCKNLLEIADATLETIHSIMGFSHGSFATVEERTINFLKVTGQVASSSVGHPLDGPGVTAKTARTGETQLIADTRLERDYVGPRTAPKDRVYLSELAVPIKIREKVAAVLNIESDKTNAFTDQDRKLTELFAEHVASAMDRIRAQESEHAYQVKLQVVYGHSQKLTAAKSVEEIENLTHNALTQTLGFRAGAFGLVDGGLLRFNTVWGYEGQENVMPLDGPGASVRAVKTGRTQNIRDVRQDPDWVNYPLPEGYTPLSELDTPVKLDGRVIAVICVEADRLNAFTDEDVILVETFAENVASAMGRLRYQMDLERTVEEKTSELKEANLKLQNYNDELRKLDEMKSQFISAATHELKTPLASIIGYLELFNESSHESLSDNDRELLKVVGRNTNRLKQLTEDLLDLHRIDSGRIEIKKEGLDVEKLVQQSITELHPLLNEKKQRINLTTKMDGKIVQADRLRINQVLYNLIENASKFSPENSEIDINIEEDEGAVKISVRDRGIGMSTDDLTKLFTTFSMIRKKNHYVGTGLGLSICKGIIELHGGKIWGESRGHDKGSTFTFTLPLKKTE